MVQRVFTNLNKLDFTAAFELYSTDKDARHLADGYFYSSRNDLKRSYEDLLPSLEILKYDVDSASWDIIVLGSNAVAVTVPINFSIKIKGLREYQCVLQWSGVVQRRVGNWMIVQSHESWMNSVYNYDAAKKVEAAIGVRPSELSLKKEIEKKMKEHPEQGILYGRNPSHIDIRLYQLESKGYTISSSSKGNTITWGIRMGAHPRQKRNPQRNNGINCKIKAVRPRQVGFHIYL